MKYWWRLIMLLPIITLIIGCNKEIRPEQYNCMFVKNAEIKGEGGNFISITDGKKIVFVYHYTSAYYGATDTSTWEVLSFEVDPNSRSLEFIDDEIEKANCTCSITGPWSYGGGKAKSGSIMGKKLASGEYELTVNINVPFTYTSGETKKYRIRFRRIFSEYEGKYTQLQIPTILDIKDY